jgi:subtilase family serine protease
MFTSSTSPGKWQISFAVMCVATSLAYKSIIIPFYVGYVFVAIFIVFEMTVEFC